MQVSVRGGWVVAWVRGKGHQGWLVEVPKCILWSYDSTEKLHYTLNDGYDASGY